MKLKKLVISIRGTENLDQTHKKNIYLNKDYGTFS